MDKATKKWYSMGFPPLHIGSQNGVKRIHLVAMVGLPGRGKTCTVYKLHRYLKWVGYKTKVFTVNDIGSESSKESLFEETVKILQDVAEWVKTIEDNITVPIIDGENLIAEVRNLVHNIAVNQLGFRLFFVELICDDLEIIERSISESKALFGDDDTQMFMKKLMEDHVYEQIDGLQEPHLNFMKILNLGKKFIIHKHYGHLEGRVIYFVINTYVLTHIIYISRHGESEMNVLGRIGGNSSLTKNGKAYALALAKFIEEESVPKGLRVWTSWMKRTIETAKHIHLPQERWKSLNEINAGIFEGKTYHEIETESPAEFQARAADKYNYRYPGGESYKDVNGRLEPIVIEMERQGNILVIAHQSVIRCLLGYFLDITADILPRLKIPLHTVFKLTIVPSGIKVERISIPVEAVDTTYILDAIDVPEKSIRI